MSIYSAVDCGTLKYIKADDRPSSYVLTDSSIPTSAATADEVDLSADVPNGTKALLFSYIVWSNDTNDLAILHTRESGATTTVGQKTYTAYFQAEQGAVSTFGISGIFVIYAPNGKFEYWTNSTYSVTDIRLMLWGYYL
jgi:hypothetical protein